MQTRPRRKNKTNQTSNNSITLSGARVYQTPEFELDYDVEYRETCQVSIITLSPFELFKLLLSLRRLQREFVASEKDMEVPDLHHGPPCRQQKTVCRDRTSLSAELKRDTTRGGPNHIPRG